MTSARTVLSIEAKPEVKAGDNLYQRGILIDCDVFQHCIRRAYAQGYTHFITDVLQRNVDRLRIFGYNIKDMQNGLILFIPTSRSTWTCATAASGMNCS